VSCASLENIPIQDYIIPPESELSTIYLYRTNSMPTKANVEFKIDNIKIALLPDDRFTWVQVQPGKYLLWASYGAILDMTARLQVDLEPKKTYLFQYDGQGSGGAGYPIYGSDGKLIGYVGSDSRAWTKLNELSPSQINDIVIYTKYVSSKY